MARPRLEETRSNYSIRLSSAERREVEQRAALLGLKPTAYIRKCIVQGTVRVVQEEGHDPAKVRALVAIGNNLNQIARRMNASEAEAPPQLGALLEAIQEIVTESGRQRGPQG